jgi:hypothetical protein
LASRRLEGGCNWCHLSLSPLPQVTPHQHKAYTAKTAHHQGWNQDGEQELPTIATSDVDDAVVAVACGHGKRATVVLAAAGCRRRRRNNTYAWLSIDDRFSSCWISRRRRRRRGIGNDFAVN